MTRGWRWWRHELECRQAVALVTDYLEGALPRQQRALLEQHLGECPHCSMYLEQIQATIRALGRVDVDTLPQETRDGLVDLFRRYQSER